MLAVINNSTDPAFCLAAEEFLLENRAEGEYLMLWRGDRSVIAGKFQNVYEEVSLLECQKNNIPIYRRNSGGGTVYHDLGNVNYSIFADKSENTPDYERFLTPMVNILRKIGLKAEIGSAFDIVVDGKKISGSAQSVRGRRVMHHGTLLFDADLSLLRQITGHARDRITSKAIKSSPAEVADITEFVQNININEFMNTIKSQLCEGERHFSEKELDEVNRTAEEKYRTFEWNYGRSPAFELKSEKISLGVKNGIIKSSSVYAERLIGKKLLPEVVFDAVSPVESECAAEELVREIFS